MRVINNHQLLTDVKNTITDIDNEKFITNLSVFEYKIKKAMNDKLVIRVKEVDDGWLSDGGERVDNKEDAKQFDSIYKAVDTSRRSGLTEDTAEVHWDLE